MTYRGSCYSGLGAQAGCCGGSAGYASPSQLEIAAAEYIPPATPGETMRMSEEMAARESPGAVLMQHYGSASAEYGEGMYLGAGSRKYYFSPSDFLNSTPTEFISCKSREQKELVESVARQAFERTTGTEIPGDIAIRICSADGMRKLHRSWHPGIRGFSINRKGFGVSEVFVAEDELARLMLTIGHEIGHVLTFPMKEHVDEEAKAFAFSLAWMDAIRESGTDGLSEAICPRPADNGLHNVAFGFVAGMVKGGRKAIDIYSDLIKGEISAGGIAVS